MKLVSFIKLEMFRVLFFKLSVVRGLFHICMIVIDEVVQNGILHGFKHKARNKTKKKNTSVSGNAGDEKFFLINLTEFFQ